MKTTMKQTPFEVFSNEREFIAPFFTRLFGEEIKYKSLKLLNEDNNTQTIQIVLEAKNKQGEYEAFSTIFHWLALDIELYAIQRYVADQTKHLLLHDLMHEDRERHIQIFCTLNKTSTDKTDFIRLNNMITGMTTGVELGGGDGSIFEQRVSCYYLIDLCSVEDFSLQKLIEEMKNYNYK